MKKLAVIYLFVASSIARVASECIKRSLASYGLQSGEKFSSIDQSLNIDFNSTMHLSQATACFGPKGQMFSIELATKSSNSQGVNLSRYGEIIGTCKTVYLADGFAKYLSIYYTAAFVTGLKIQTESNTSLELGNVSGNQSWQFAFEPN